MTQGIRPPWRIGDRVHRARIEAGMEQQQLAHLVGVSHSTIGRWEKGKGEPSVDQVRAIAHATGVDVLWLLGIDEDVSLPTGRSVEQLPFDWDGYLSQFNRECALVGAL